MESLIRMKADANRMFTVGNRIFPDDACFPSFKKACIKYQEIVSAMIKFECDGIEKSGADLFLSDERSYEEYAYFKASIFSNYALANFKLNNFDGCNRLCNVCIFLCLNPRVCVRDIDMIALVDLYVSSMAPAANTTTTDVAGADSDHSSTNIDSLQEKLRKLAGKATFRRGQVYLERDNYRSAIADFEAALAFFPTDKEILLCLEEAKNLLDQEKEHGGGINKSIDDTTIMGETGNISARGSDKHLFVREFSANFPKFTTNGGVCLNGTSIWSQTKEVTKVYIPIEIVTNAERGRIQSSKLKLIFKKMNVEIIHDNVMIFEAKLEYFIEKSKCKWSLKPASKLLEKAGYSPPILINSNTNSNGVSSSSNNVNSICNISVSDRNEVEGSRGDIVNNTTAFSSSIRDVSVLTLQLCKVPSLEYFPGCEWWDRVFPSDQPVLVPLEAAEADLVAKGLDDSDGISSFSSTCGGGEKGCPSDDTAAISTVFTNAAVFHADAFQNADVGDS